MGDRRRPRTTGRPAGELEEGRVLGHRLVGCEAPRGALTGQSIGRATDRHHPVALGLSGRGEDRLLGDQPGRVQLHQDVFDPPHLTCRGAQCGGGGRWPPAKRPPAAHRTRHRGIPTRSGGRAAPGYSGPGRQRPCVPPPGGTHPGAPHRIGARRVGHGSPRAPHRAPGGSPRQLLGPNSALRASRCSRRGPGARPSTGPELAARTAGPGGRGRPRRTEVRPRAQFGEE